MAVAEAPAAAAAAEAADGMVWADAGAGAASGGGTDTDDEEGGLAAYADETPADDVAAVSRRQLIHSALLSCGATGSCCSLLDTPPPKAVPATESVQISAAELARSCSDARYPSNLSWRPALQLIPSCRMGCRRLAQQRLLHRQWKWTPPWPRRPLGCSGC